VIVVFHHLQLEEREKLFGWKSQGKSFRWIAKKLGRNVGSISREWKRHTRYGKPYLPCLAQRRADRWADAQRYHAPLKEPLIFLYVREHLRSPYRWSPETIAGRLSLDHPGFSIDQETIYRYIYGRRQKRMKLWKYLVLHRRKRMKKHGRKVTDRGTVVEAIPIEKRPKVVEKRNQRGHWETDNLEGKRSDRTGISVSVERVTRMTRLRKLADHTAMSKTDALLVQFSQESKRHKKSITLDNGPENKDGGLFHQLTGITRYKTTPYHSWEKGTVENTIGRVRRWIPKKKSVDGITQHHLTLIEEQMNNTPRKILRYLTPNEVYGKMSPASRTF
jgi:transposase, IS30 family